MPAVRIKVVLFLLGSLSFPAQAADPIAGSVKTAIGSAVLVRGAETVPVREGMHLLMNDRLRTAADGRVGVIFQDGTRISLGPDTEVTIDRFVYAPADGKFGLLLRLARGVFTYVSGKIAQFSPESVSVQTPAAIVGLRGTHFAVSTEGI
jgi:hypothetical protein